MSLNPNSQRHHYSPKEAGKGWQFTGSPEAAKGGMEYGKMQYAKDIKEMSLFQMISEKSDAQNAEVSDGGLEAIYTWVDTVPVSRPKRNI
jgi:hypothetical protein